MSAAAIPLADLQVNLVARGLDQFKGQLGQLAPGLARTQAGLDAVKKSVESVGASILDVLKAPLVFPEPEPKRKKTQGDFDQEAAARFARGLKAVEANLNSLVAGMQAVGRVATLALGGAAVATYGFAKAGLAGTVEGEALTLRFQFLSREITSVFLPVIESVINGVASVVNWFRSLDGEQQAQIRSWALAGAAVLGVATLLPRVAALIVPVVTGVISLTGSLLGLNIASGGIIPAIGAIVTALVALGFGAVVLSTSGKEAKGALATLFDLLKAGWKAVQPLVDVVKYAAAAVHDAFAGMASQVGPLVTGLLGRVGEAFDRLGPPIKQLIDRMAPFLDLMAKVAGLSIAAAFDLAARAIELMAFHLEVVVKGLLKLIEVWDNMPPALKFIAAGPLGAALLGGGGGKKDDKKPDEKRPRSDVTLAGGGLESIEATWSRIQEAANKGDFKSEDEKTRDKLDEVKKAQEETTEAVKQIRPAVGR